MPHKSLRSRLNGTGHPNKEPARVSSGTHDLMPAPSSRMISESVMGVCSNNVNSVTANSYVHHKVLDKFMYLLRTNGRDPLQILRSRSLWSGGDFYDPPHKMLEIGHMLCHPEPLAIAVCKLPYSLVPEVSPYI
jgi:hypothetical protein